LTVQITDVYTFYAPNAFSPDNDGKNDFFFVTGHGMEEQTFDLKIYDRWGGIVWSTTSINDQWNGNTKSGKKSPVGTYTWLVHYKDETGIAHVFSGAVTIIR
jgi:gliding motility-associated-like protein